MVALSGCGLRGSENPCCGWCPFKPRLGNLLFAPGYTRRQRAEAQRGNHAIYFHSTATSLLFSSVGFQLIYHFYTGSLICSPKRLQLAEDKETTVLIQIHWQGSLQRQTNHLRKWFVVPSLNGSKLLVFTPVTGTNHQTRCRYPWLKGKTARKTTTCGFSQLV